MAGIFRSPAQGIKERHAYRHS